ncbi:MAG: hypothetical protein K2Y71_14805 [Xanthobacteraceae bacterium]|nr:hypothetical protein [Xanthobacteraceae bacterium]
MSPKGHADMTAALSLDTAAPRIPLWLKLVYTAFMAVLVPVYLYYYGWTNFLYFCDVALILTLIAVWKENALLVSMGAVGIIVPQIIWVIDFVATAIGLPVVHMTAYMFNASTSLFLRGLSLFHGWLPFLLIYLTMKLGYDRRALVAWTVLAWVLILICFLFMPPPNPNAGLTPVNINYVFGFNDATAQTWMPAWAWVIGMIVVMPIVFFLPVHVLFSRWMPKAPVQAAK